MGCSSAKGGRVYTSSTSKKGRRHFVKKKKGSSDICAERWGFAVSTCRPERKRGGKSQSTEEHALAEKKVQGKGGKNRESVSKLQRKTAYHQGDLSTPQRRGFGVGRAGEDFM